MATFTDLLCLICMHVCTHLCVLIQGELQLMKLQLEETKQRVDTQKAEQRKLQKIIADADAEQIQQKKQLEQVKKEKEEDKTKQSKRMTNRDLYLIICWQNFCQGDQRTGQPGKTAATPQR